AERSTEMANPTMKTRSERVATDETGSLIAASKVHGTNVYNGQGGSLGSIYDVMIDKRSGNVAYAVMAFGGFLGMGEDYHPLPWSVLTYNPTLGGYEINVTEQQLKNAPKYSRYESWDWADRARTEKVSHFYGL